MKRLFLLVCVVVLCTFVYNKCTRIEKARNYKEAQEIKKADWEMKKRAIDSLAVVDYALSEEELEKINRVLVMEDFDEANIIVATMITKNHQNLPLFERVWKAAARSYVQNDDMKGLTRLINTISAYNILNAPLDLDFIEWQAIGFAEKGGSDDYYKKYVEDYRRYKTGGIVRDETARFNSVIDDLFEIALQNDNKEMAKAMLELYRADLELTGKPDGRRKWQTCESSKEEKARKLEE